jgi:hypothetical protein
MTAGDDGIPQPGDLIIFKLHGPGQDERYGIGPHGSPLQLSEATYDLARRRAIFFAQSLGVDIWYTEDDETYSFVASFADPMGV